jgi:hypothetical protein
MKNTATEYDAVVTALVAKIIEVEIFKDKDEVVLLNKDDFERIVTEKVSKKIQKAVSELKFLVQLGIPLESAAVLTVMMQDSDRKDLDDLSTDSIEEHNCEICPNKGHCPLEETMRMINKKEVTPDDKIEPEDKPSEN